MDKKESLTEVVDDNVTFVINTTKLVTIQDLESQLAAAESRAEQAEAEIEQLRKALDSANESNGRIDAELYQMTIAKEQAEARLKAYDIFEPCDYKRLEAEVESLKEAKSEYSEGFKTMLERVKRYKKALELACKDASQECDLCPVGIEKCGEGNCIKEITNHYLAQAERGTTDAR